MNTPDNNKANDNEDNDQNKQEPHDPVAAGRAAIEAGKLANPSDDDAATIEAKEKEDAEKWRNEG